MQIPTDLDLADVVPDEVNESWAPWRLWALPRSIQSFRPTRTSKLLARKRPRLIPISDKVVAETFGFSATQWQELNAALTAKNYAFRSNLLGLRKKAEVGENVSALRVLDVIASMDRGRSKAGAEFADVLSDEH